MKKTMFLFLLSFIFINLRAQETIVPKAVKDAFTKHYPNVKDVSWSKEGSEGFEAEFKVNGVSISAVFEDDGELEEIETEIKLSELPKNAAEFIKLNYKDYVISEVAKIEKLDDDEKSVQYEAEITKGEVKKDLIFDEKGVLIQKNKKEKEEDDEDEK